MSRLSKIALALVLAAGVAEPAKAQTAPEPLRPVASEIVSTEQIGARAFPGVVAAANETGLAFQTIGRVAELLVRAGDRVSTGETLARLDRVTLEADVTRASAAADSAAATADFAAQSLTRAERLAERGIFPAAQLEAVRANNDAAQARLTAARAQLDRAKEALGYGTLTAPFDGVVLSRGAEVGTVVAAGTPVLTLARDSGREAVIDVPADFLALLPDDAGFSVQENAAGASPVPARLRLVEPVLDERLRGRRLRLTLLGSGENFRIGSLVTARLAATSAPIITLPQTALIRPDGATAGTAQVWRVDPAGRAVHRVAVETGRSLGDRVQITAGLTDGDEIVVKGVHSLTEGQAVGERLE